MNIYNLYIQWNLLYLISIHNLQSYISTNIQKNIKSWKSAQTVNNQHKQRDGSQIGYLLPRSRLSSGLPGYCSGGNCHIFWQLLAELRSISCPPSTLTRWPGDRGLLLMHNSGGQFQRKTRGVHGDPPAASIITMNHRPEVWNTSCSEI